MRTTAVTQRLKTAATHIPRLAQTAMVVILALVACVISALITLIILVEGAAQDPQIPAAVKETLPAFREGAVTEMGITLAATILFLAYIAHMALPQRQVR